MPLPSSIKKAVVQEKSTDILEAIGTATVSMPVPKPDEVLVKNRFLGVNATDLNASICHGQYYGKVPPFDLGVEGIGEIAALGSNVESHKMGQTVGYMSSDAGTRNSFAEYVAVPALNLLSLPNKAKPEFVSLFVSGLTASIGLDKNGNLKPSEKVLITAAAGGTGHIAVQWAKQAECHVIGTCSSDEKVEFLKSIGCDRPINYKKEDLSAVLKSEYSDGVDVIWETIGGSTFAMLYQHLAEGGRLINLGTISSYKTADLMKSVQLDYFPIKVIVQSLTISGFFLARNKSDYEAYLSKLLTMQAEGKLKITTDTGDSSPEGKFVGIESIPRALQHLHTGKNLGKVVVTL